MDSIESPITYHFVRRALLLTVLCLCFIVVLVACKRGDQNRPYGWVRVGEVSKLLEAETPVSERSLLIRRDQGGFSGMSILCTHDLVPVRREGDGLVCGECGSRYALDGTLLHGPAKRPLPYYSLRFDRGVIDGPVDTLYSEIGREVAKSWRLPLSPQQP